MKITIKILTAIIILLSIGAGLAKVMQVPQEVAFLEGVGLTTLMIIAFGVFQILGGLLTAIPKSKFYGSVIVIVGFIISTILIFLTENVKFGMISMVPVILAGVVAFTSIKNTRN